MQHGAQQAGLAGQDDGEFVAVELAGFGQDLIRTAEDVLAVVGLVMPGVRAGDHHQISGDLDRLTYLCRSVPGSSACQVNGRDLD